MPVDDDTRPPTRRERLRRQTVDEIVQEALRLVDAGGAHGLSLASVGKAMGLTPPALYHYFASREALLDALVLAGYTDLGTAVEAAARAAADRPAPERLSAIAHAWRRWALDHPRRYSMLFTGSRRETVDPLESVSTISQSMLALVTTLQEVAADAGAWTGPAVSSVLDEDLCRWGASLGLPTAAAPSLRLALSTWYRVHGLVSLEIVGAFDTMGLDGERLLTAEIESLVGEAARP
ncbi:transcriptional regulator, TetR family [Promicromonospora umidemergens]|uniref:TetR/AcrR family transcriptional regulator n=1 Tax=Promicromonospora umidemergens TaxID=629679 RepID=A0ABP8XKB8_9MICO|nr:TetR/AcrR family transcriptional regulator [Promicromonospora umidemergens]MCP2282113.1 transcriptional regulator, TetR family [Promicromonospora umidemergens]